MAYVKTVWQNGSAPYIDAEHLNNIENGIYDNEQALTELQELVSELSATVQRLESAIEELNGGD